MTGDQIQNSCICKQYAILLSTGWFSAGLLPALGPEINPFRALGGIYDAGNLTQFSSV